MKYELAKKLKDARFIQEGKGESVIYKTQSVGFSTQLSSPVIYIPTLSELIEACNPLKLDEFIITTTSPQYWTAIANYVGYFKDYPSRFYDEDGMANVHSIGIGDTAEEAVVYLWLELHK